MAAAHNSFSLTFDVYIDIDAQGRCFCIILEIQYPPQHTTHTSINIYCNEVLYSSPYNSEEWNVVVFLSVLNMLFSTHWTWYLQTVLFIDGKI